MARELRTVPVWRRTERGYGPLRVLLLEDDEDHAVLVQHFLRRVFQAVEVTRAATLADALACLESKPQDVVVADLGLPDAVGSQTVEALAPLLGETVLVVLTGNGEERTAIEALRLGAQDFLVKGALTADALRRSIVYAFERQRLQEELRRAADLDSLTGLLGRAPFRRHVERALRRVERHGGTVGVLFVDLDGFKRVNDGFGHAAGDRLLVRIAERLRGCTRDSDVVARMGGDEFAILLEQPDRQEVDRVANRILEHLRIPVRIGAAELRPAGSIGIAMPDDPAIGADELLRQADAAMYEAKHAGRNQHRFFDEQLRWAERRRQRSVRRLRAAVVRDEFCVYYQPLWSVRHQRILGAEALLRWNHPTRGVVAPSEFIDVLERQHMITDVGDRVLRECCRQLASIDARRRVPISINVAPAQFESLDFSKRIETLLRQHGVPARMLTLDITEALLMGDAQRARGVVEDLADLGVGIAVDDFGAGHSSLRDLRSLPLTSIKIDRCFISGREEPGVDAAVVSSVVQLAHAAGWSIVAEGVETERQLAELRELDCDAWQGFLHGQPVAWERWRAMLTARDGTPE